jgi:hypothetical protein
MCGEKKLLQSDEIITMVKGVLCNVTEIVVKSVLSIGHDYYCRYDKISFCSIKEFVISQNCSAVTLFIVTTKNTVSVVDNTIIVVTQTVFVVTANSVFVVSKNLSCRQNFVVSTNSLSYCSFRHVADRLASHCHAGLAKFS